jgi:uncharacterized delta-60 repeat protein
VRLKLAILALVVAGAVGSTTALALPGDLDPGFGSGGILVHDLGASDNAFAVTVQPDGRVIAVGGSAGAVALARYSASGVLDPSFGTGGTVATPLDGFALALDVALQPDGKIVVVGTAGGGNDLLLARYHADGRLDASFDGDGVVRANVGSPTSGSGVAVQPDGRIVAVGRVDSPFDPHFSSFAVFRFETSGAPDTTFAGTGRVVTRVGPLGAATDLALLSNGRIAVAGAAGFGTDRQFVVAVYDSEGQLATDFGSGGIASVDFGGFDEATAIATQQDGKVVVVGRSTNSFALARLLPSGSPDGDFDGDGRLLTEFDTGPFATAEDVVVQSNGKIIAAGTSFGPSGSFFAIARYMPSGAPDPDFGDEGRVTTAFGRPATLRGIALAPDGDIVGAGPTAGTCEPSGFCPSNFGLARYDGDPVALAVEIDVRPGNNTNPVKPGIGLVVVAVVTSASFDASQVDAASVCFGDADRAAERDCTEVHGRGHLEDTNGDGRSDLVLHFEAAETGIDAGDTTACLTGRTTAGAAIQGCDRIQTG